MFPLLSEYRRFFFSFVKGPSLYYFHIHTLTIFFSQHPTINYLTIKQAGNDALRDGMESYNIIIWLGDINCYSVGMEDDGRNYYYTNVALRNFTSPHLIKVVGVGCPRNDEQC